MKLFTLKKKPLQNSTGQNLDLLIDGELPFGWVYHYKDFYKPKNDKMVELASKTQVKDTDDRISALQTLIDYFYSYKNECREKGECFEKYFELEWMHCKNSKCDDFIYITPYENELNDLLRTRKEE